MLRARNKVSLTSWHHLETESQGHIWSSAWANRIPWKSRSRHLEIRVQVLLQLLCYIVTLGSLTPSGPQFPQSVSVISNGFPTPEALWEGSNQQCHRSLVFSSYGRQTTLNLFIWRKIIQKNVSWKTPGSICKMIKMQWWALLINVCWDMRKSRARCCHSSLGGAGKDLGAVARSLAAGKRGREKWVGGWVTIPAGTLLVSVILNKPLCLSGPQVLQL